MDLPKILEGKRIILGVCGSVAIYKAIELIRILQNLGASVRVVMSKGSLEFINPLLFEAISRHKVLHKGSQSWGENPNNHIEICQNADAFIIAPASVNTINKISSGIADDVLLESFIAFSGVKIIAPAANTKMIENEATMESLRILRKRGVNIVNSACKELACGIVGNGALAKPVEIAFQSIRAMFREQNFSDINICVSGGGSKEKIDAVRYISNYSSGKMGAYLAMAAYFLGANVEFIAPNAPFALPLSIKHTIVQSAQDYLDAIQNWQNSIISNNAFLFMSAAISDYVPKVVSDTKLKKQDLGNEWNLCLKQSIDILKSIEKKQKTIGFKLESNQNIEAAKTALKDKNLDAICLNYINLEHNPLESQNNQILWIDNKESLDLGFHHKLDLAFKILNKAKNL